MTMMMMMIFMMVMVEMMKVMKNPAVTNTMLCGGDVGQLSAAARPCADISTGCPKKKLLLNRILLETKNSKQN